MKFLSGHLGYALGDDQLRRNLAGLLRYVVFLTVVIAVYSVLFHVIMWRIEGQEHSWITGFYWTLTVMSTLGFGDITFESDIGRLFSVLVLVSGIILLLIVLPFAFIRYFYAPWLEARLRVRAPRAVAPGVRDHVVVAAWDDVARALVPRFRDDDVPFVVLEEDGARATELVLDDIPAVRGQVDDVATWQGLGVDRARLVVLNRDDLSSTNAALTLREVASDTRIVALAEREHSVDILELGGCDAVLDLKARLGDQLANRVSAGQNQAHRVGSYRGLHVAEFSTHGTPFAGRTLAEIRLRAVAGLSVVGVWERGVLNPPRPDQRLGPRSLLVVVGSEAAMTRLDEFLAIYDMNWNAVVVIGGGVVGRAAARALAARSIPVHMVEQEPSVAARVGDLPARLVVGDAADRSVMDEVGVADAPSIVLSTNHDATNIFLASYCRRLNPETHIVSRLTHDRNIAAMHRAGADQTLSYTSLAVESIVSILHERPPLFLGLGARFHELPCPADLAGRTLADAQVGQRSGLTVIGIEDTDGTLEADPGPDTVLPAGGRLLVIASDEQVADFRRMAAG